MILFSLKLVITPTYPHFWTPTNICDTNFISQSRKGMGIAPKRPCPRKLSKCPLKFRLFLARNFDLIFFKMRALGPTGNIEGTLWNTLPHLFAILCNNHISPKVKDTEADTVSIGFDRAPGYEGREQYLRGHLRQPLLIIPCNRVAHCGPPLS